MPRNPKRTPATTWKIISFVCFKISLQDSSVRKVRKNSTSPPEMDMRQIVARPFLLLEVNIFILINHDCLLAEIILQNSRYLVPPHSTCLPLLVGRWVVGHVFNHMRSFLTLPSLILTCAPRYVGRIQPRWRKRLTTKPTASGSQ